MVPTRNAAPLAPANAPLASARAATPVQAPAAKAPAPMAQDGYASTDVRVITYNTAVGNSHIKTNQADFPMLPFYQDVLQGRPGAPILALQEVGNAQRQAVERLAKSGNFTVLGQHVGLRGRQNNMILIPKRFQVLEAKNHYFVKDHLVGAAKTLWGWVKGGFKEHLNVSQLIEPRGYQQLRLKDTLTGRTLTVFNAHVSYYGDLKVAHTGRLFEAARKAGQAGPVIVAGDLNTRTADTDPGTDASHAGSRANFKGFKDMGPTGAPPDKTNIDWVLTQGFDGVSSRWYTGKDLSLPGSPDAKAVSDHYAEEDVVRFAANG